MAHFFYKFQKGIYNGMLISGTKGGSYELVFESYGKGDEVEMCLKNVFTDTSTEISEELLLEKLGDGDIWPLHHQWLPSVKWLKSIGEGAQELEIEELIETN